MADLYVGGFKLFEKRYKSLYEAVENARMGDVIHLLKNENLGKIYDKNTKKDIFKTLPVNTKITVEGPAVITTEENTAAMELSDYDITFKNITFKVAAKSNVLILPSGYNGIAEFSDCKFLMDINSDPRDWYPLIVSKSPYARYSFINTESPFMNLSGYAAQFKNCSMGSLYGPLSSVNCDNINIDGGLFTNIEFFSHSIRNDTGTEALCSVRNIKTEGFLSLMGYKGMAENIEFILKNINASDYRKSFLDNSLYREIIEGLFILKCSDFTLKNFTQDIETDIPWYSLNIKDSDILMSDFDIKSSPYMNVLENSSLRLQNINDFSQWQKYGDVKESKTGSKTENGGAFLKLQSLIGLENVKHQLDEMISMAIADEELRKRGLKKSHGFSFHMVFAGSAGTGKTTVAKLFGEALYEEGILPSAKFTIATRKDLVGQYVGHTAIKTHDLIEKSRGGVLFIDEAYSLRSKPGTNDFAGEAVDQLVMDSEELREDTVIILAGYTDEMTDFIENTNPGLKSRFKNFINFPDYSFSELLRIIDFTLESQGVFTEDSDFLYESFKKIFSSRGGAEGNARFVRNYVQDLIQAKNLRIASFIRSGFDMPDEKLLKIEPQDIIKTEEKYLMRG